MKTLDEVIEILEKVVKHDYVWFDEKTALMTIETLTDTLQYLREYQWQMTNPDGDHQQLEKAQKLLWEFYQNDPLTWGELREMEGKPVWVEWTKTEESYWCFVGEWFDDDEMRIYHMGRDDADYIHKTIYTPDIVRVYRKERTDERS